jgi:hypothetical protein
MYLIEIHPGTEILYHSVEELRAAIHSGQVTSQARIYHRNSAMWVPITVHPEYKKATAEGEPLGLPRIKRKRWTFFASGDAEEPVRGAPPGAVNNGETRAEPEPYPMLLPEGGKPRFRQLVRGAMRRLRIPGSA